MPARTEKIKIEVSLNKKGYMQGVRSINQGLSSVKNLAHEVTGELQSLTNKLGMWTAAGVAGFAALTIAAVKAYAELEMGRAAFASVAAGLTGVKEAGYEAYDMMSEFAAETPFFLNEILEGARTMLTFRTATLSTSQSIHQMQDDLMILGVTGRMVGRSFADIATSMGILRTGMFRIRQLVPLGITREKLAERGVQFTKAGGLVSPQEGIKAYEEAMNILREMWGDFAEEIEQFLTSRLEKIKGRINVWLRELGGVIAPALRPAIESVLESIGELRNAFRELYKDPQALATLQQIFVDIGDAAEKGFKRIIAWLKELAKDPDRIARGFQRIVKALKAMVIVWASLQIGLWITKLGLVLIAVRALAPAVWAALGPIGLLALAIAGLITASMLLAEWQRKKQEAIFKAAEEAKRAAEIAIRASQAEYIHRMEVEKLVEEMRELAEKTEDSAEKTELLEGKFEQLKEIIPGLEGKFEDLATAAGGYEKALDGIIGKLKELANLTETELKATRTGMMNALIVLEKERVDLERKIAPWADEYFPRPEEEGVSLEIWKGVERWKIRLDRVNEAIAEANKGLGEVGSQMRVRRGEISPFPYPDKWPTFFEKEPPDITTPGLDEEEDAASKALEADREAYQLALQRIAIDEELAKIGKDALHQAYEGIKFQELRVKLAEQHLGMATEQVDVDKAAAALATLRGKLEPLRIEYLKRRRDLQEKEALVEKEGLERLQLERGFVEERLRELRVELELDRDNLDTREQIVALYSLLLGIEKDINSEIERRVSLSRAAAKAAHDEMVASLQIEVAHEGRLYDLAHPEETTLQRAQRELEGMKGSLGKTRFPTTKEDWDQYYQDLEEAEAKVNRARWDMEQAWIDMVSGIGQSIASGAIQQGIDQVGSMLSAKIAEMLQKLTAQGTFGGGFGGQLFGGFLSGVAGGLISGAFTALGGLFKKGPKGGIEVEQIDTWVVKSERRNLPFALAQSYLLSGRGLAAVDVGTVNVTQSGYQPGQMGREFEKTVTRELSREQKRGRTY